MTDNAKSHDRISLVPTWKGILPLLLAVYTGTENPEARAEALKELERMAAAADLAVQQGGQG